MKLNKVSNLVFDHSNRSDLAGRFLDILSLLTDLIEFRKSKQTMPRAAAPLAATERPTII